MTRAERERRRYIAVRNRTYDTALARKARGWSDDRILETFGIRVPQRTPELKPLPTGKQLAQRKQQATLRIAKFNAARSQGATIERAKRLKNRSWATIRNETSIEPKPREKFTSTTRENRMDQWSSWSRRGNYPPQIKQRVKEINREAGFDDNARYGWAVMFYSYIENESIDKWKDLLQADPHDGDKYIIATRGVA